MELCLVTKNLNSETADHFKSKFQDFVVLQQYKGSRVNHIKETATLSNHQTVAHFAISAEADIETESNNYPHKETIMQ
jgi:hypothetical protein